MIEINTRDGRRIVVIAWETSYRVGNVRCAVCGELTREAITVNFGKLSFFVCVNCTGKEYTESKAFAGVIQ